MEKPVPGSKKGTKKPVPAAKKPAASVPEEPSDPPWFKAMQDEIIKSGADPYVIEMQEKAKARREQAAERSRALRTKGVEGPGASGYDPEEAAAQAQRRMDELVRRANERALELQRERAGRIRARQTLPARP